MRMTTTLEQFEILSEEQVAVLRALLDGASVTDAARVGGVSRQTASEWGRVSIPNRDVKRGSDGWVHISNIATIRPCPYNHETRQILTTHN